MFPNSTSNVSAFLFQNMIYLGGKKLCTMLITINYSFDFMRKTNGTLRLIIVSSKHESNTFTRIF